MDKINIIVGPKGSGKSTILRVVNFRGFFIHELSHSVKLLEAQGHKREDLKFKRPWDHSALKLSYENCLRFCPRPLFLSGLSRPAELDYLNEKEIPYRVIAINSDRDERYARVVERSRKGEQGISFEDFLIKESRRLGQVEGYEANDLDSLMRMSSYQVNNKGNIAELICEVDKMLTSIGYSK